MRKGPIVVVLGIIVAGAALAVATRGAGPPRPDDPAPVVTPLGETLPPFAKARLGPAPAPATWGTVVVTADGRQAAVGHGLWNVATFDLATRGVVSTIEVEPWRPGQRRTSRVNRLGLRTVIDEAEMETQVRATAWSPGGSRLAGITAAGVSGPGESVIRLFDRTTGATSVTVPFPSAFSVRDLSISNDGTTLAILRQTNAGSGKPPCGISTVALDDPSSVRELAEGQFSRIAFSPDRTSIAALGSALTVFEVPSGRFRFATEPGKGASHIALAWSADGRRIAHGEGLPASVVVRDAADGREIWRHATGPHWIAQVAFSPDGRSLVSTGWSTGPTVHDAATGAVVATLPRDATSVAFTPDGARLVAASDTLRVFDTTTWKEIDGPPDPPVRPNATSLAWAPDGSWIVTGDAASDVRTWDAATGAQRRIAALGGAGVRDLAVSPDGATVAALLADGALVQLDAATLTERSRTAGPKRASIAWPKSLVRLDVADDGACVETDLATGATTARGSLGPQVWAAAQISDSGTLARVRAPPTNRIVSLGEGAAAPGVMTNVPPGNLNCVVFTADGRSCAAYQIGGRVGGYNFGGVRVFDVPSGTVRFELGVETGSSEIPLAVANGADLVAWSGWDSVVELWHVASGRRARRFEGTRGRITLLMFSPDGNTLAAAATDGSVMLWDVAPWRR